MRDILELIADCGEKVFRGEPTHGEEQVEVVLDRAAEEIKRLREEVASFKSAFVRAI